MNHQYVRRFRMEIDFSKVAIATPQLPEGYRWIAWQSILVDRHAAVKYQSFCAEFDSRVFPCLGEAAGCHRLMQEIARHETFLPEATWLIARKNEFSSKLADCGTIQGLVPTEDLGAVQNVGVVPEHRGLGLGRALVLQSLVGFRKCGMRRVFLEVTADNGPAVELYRSIGFEVTRTMFKMLHPDPIPAF